MRVTVLTLIALLVLAPAVSAENIGLSFGSLTTAKATGKGQTTFSGTVGVTDNTTFVAGVNYGFSDKADGRFRVGLVDTDGFDTAFGLGGDIRWQIWDEDQMGTPSTGAKKKPFDMAALGTLADSVSLKGENRIIVREGTKKIIARDRLT